VAFTVSALLMLGSLPFLLTIPGVDRDQGNASDSHFFGQLAEGWHYARTHTAIRLIFGFTLVNAMLGRTVIELLPALSGKLLDGDSTTLATLTAGAGAGSIVGGLIVSRQGGSESRLFALMAGSLAAGALLVTAMAAADQLPLVTMLVGLVSLITTIAGTTSQALAQLLVNEDYRGRVLSLWTMLAMGAPALGALLMGWLADRFSFTPVLPCFSVAALLAVVWLYRYRDDLHAGNAPQRTPG
jgi:predicted MFS family arabinose efflux permease